MRWQWFVLGIVSSKYSFALLPFVICAWHPCESWRVHLQWFKYPLTETYFPNALSSLGIYFLYIRLSILAILCGYTHLYLLQIIDICILFKSIGWQRQASPTWRTPCVKDIFVICLHINIYFIAQNTYYSSTKAQKKLKI